MVAQLDPELTLTWKAFCRDMELPIISIPSELSSTSKPTKGVFCLQRHIPCYNNASFFLVWRHSGSNARTTISSGHGPSDGSKKSTPRAHSDVFLWAQPRMSSEHGVVGIDDSEAVNEKQNMQRNDPQLFPLDIVHPDGFSSTILRRSGFDPDVMAPHLCYMKRVTSELANYINLGHNTKQACGTLPVYKNQCNVERVTYVFCLSGLVCEFFIGAHDQSVYFSALRGIQWAASTPSWEGLRDVDPLSRSLCEFYDTNGPRRMRGPSSPHSPPATNRAVYYEQNPRFPSIQSPFSGEKQWLHRSQLLAPGISPRYVGASVPKIYRDGVFQSLLTAHQADSVVRLNLSPQAPATLAAARREHTAIVSSKFAKEIGRAHV